MTKHIDLALTIILAFASFTLVQAQSTKQINLTPHPTLNLKEQSNKPLIFKTPLPPPNIGAPGKRKAGGNRGCSEY